MTHTLREEIRQNRPFASLEQEAFLSLVRTTTQLTDRLDPIFRKAGISGAQYNVLRILMGAEPDGLCRNEVRDRMVTRMPDMTRMLDRMEAAGMVSRERSEEDRRMVRTRITPQGLALVHSIEGDVAAQHTRSLGHLGPERLARLIELLQDVRNP
jgi:DNA-binding MarR family transcriptional regulator